MIEIHLFGRFRALAKNQDVRAESVRWEQTLAGDRVQDVMQRLGIGPEEVSHIFVNGEYSTASRLVRDGDRLGLFPADMALLYRQYFPKTSGSTDDRT